MSGGANPWFGSNGNMAAQKATGSNRSQRSNMSTRSFADPDNITRDEFDE